MTRRPLRKRIRRWLAGTLATLVILLAIAVALFRLLVPLVPEYHEQIEDWAGDALGWPVVIGEIDVRWRALVPEFVFREVELLPAVDEPAFARGRELAVTVSPLEFARPGPLRPGRITLRGGEFRLLRDKEGRVVAPGLPAAERSGVHETDWREVLSRLLDRTHLVIEDSRLHWEDRVLALGPWELGLDAVELRSRGDRHRLAARFTLPEGLGRATSISITAEGEPARPEGWHWRVDHEAVSGRSALELPPEQTLVESPSALGVFHSQLEERQLACHGLLPSSVTLHRTGGPPDGLGRT
jgi:uncharacterized protein YhdP